MRDQLKKKEPKGPTIRAKFGTYRFADYKNNVIDLLPQVTSVRVEILKGVDARKGAGR